MEDASLLFFDSFFYMALHIYIYIKADYLSKLNLTYF